MEVTAVRKLRSVEGAETQRLPARVRHCRAEDQTLSHLGLCSAAMRPFKHRLSLQEFGASDKGHFSM